MRTLFKKLDPWPQMAPAFHGKIYEKKEFAYDAAQEIHGQIFNRITTNVRVPLFLAVQIEL